MSAASPRPRNAEATQARILDEAGVLFARLGYRATTVKRIADKAGVSPNLITRYFGGKEGLFLATARIRGAQEGVFVGDPAGFGDRLAHIIVRRWTGHDGSDPLLVLLRAAGEHPDAAKALARFLDENSTNAIASYLHDCGVRDTDARQRAEAIDAFVLGASTRRRILRADLGEPEHLRRWLSESIQRLAWGP